MSANEENNNGLDYINMELDEVIRIERQQQRGRGGRFKRQQRDQREQREQGSGGNVIKQQFNRRNNFKQKLDEIRVPTQPKDLIIQRNDNQRTFRLNQKKKTKLRIQNLPIDVDIPDIQNLCDECGKPVSISIEWKAQANSKVAVLVEFSKESEAQKAFEDYNGALLDNVPLAVEFVE